MVSQSVTSVLGASQGLGSMSLNKLEYKLLSLTDKLIYSPRTALGISFQTVLCREGRRLCAVLYKVTQAWGLSPFSLPPSLFVPALLQPPQGRGPPRSSLQPQHKGSVKPLATQEQSSSALQRGRQIRDQCV